VRGPHELLGVAPDASRAEVIAAFRRFALRNHPDRGGDPERFGAGAEAYRRLLGHARPTAAAPRADVVFHHRRRPGLGGVLRRARHAVARPRR